jgi:hypothetical protein
MNTLAARRAAVYKGAGRDQSVPVAIATIPQTEKECGVINQIDQAQIVAGGITPGGLQTDKNVCGSGFGP